MRGSIKAVGALAALGLIGGAAYTYSVPSLSVTVLLSEDGPDVTDRIALEVVEVVETDSADGLDFSVIGEGQPLGEGATRLHPGLFRVTADLLGNVRLKETIALNRFEHINREIVLDAALVSAEILPNDPDAVQFQIEYETANGGGGGTQYLPENGPAQLFFTSDTVAARIGDGGPLRDLPLDAAPGTVQQATVDLRSATLSLQVQTEPAWPDGVPARLIWQVTDGTGKVTEVMSEGLDLTLPDLPLGGYSVTVGLSDYAGYGDMVIPTSMDGIAEANQTAPIAISLEIPVVEVALSGAERLADAPDGTQLRLVVAETGYKGIPYGDVLVPVGREKAQIVVAPAEEDAESPFGVFVYQVLPSGGETIIGFAESGPLASGQVMQVDLALGSGHQGCSALYAERDCQGILDIGEN